MRRALFLVVWTSFGCSGVPDVTFADAGAVADAAADTTPFVDASKPVDAGVVYNCPDHPPPFTAGVCCGARLCVNCNFLQCDRCTKEDCKSPDVCCAKNAGTMGNNVACQSAATCN